MLERVKRKRSFSLYKIKQKTKQKCAKRTSRKQENGMFFLDDDKERQMNQRNVFFTIEV